MFSTIVSGGIPAPPPLLSPALPPAFLFTLSLPTWIIKAFLKEESYGILCMFVVEFISIA